MVAKIWISIALVTVAGFWINIDAAYAQKLGKYEFNFGQITGEMTVRDISACEISSSLGCMSSARPIKVHIKTVNQAGNDCDVDAIEDTSGRIQSLGKTETILVIDDVKSQGKPNLSISFEGDGAVVEPSKSGSDIGCGSGVRYDGRWHLQSGAKKQVVNNNSPVNLSDPFTRCMNAVDLGAMKNAQFASCFDAELGRRDAELNKSYTKLRAKLDLQKQKLLLQGQRAWIAYRDAWCAFEEASEQAPSSQVNKLDCLVKLTKSQIEQINLFSR